MINQFKDYRKKKEEEMRQRKRAFEEGEMIIWCKLCVFAKMLLNYYNIVLLVLLEQESVYQIIIY